MMLHRILPSRARWVLLLAAAALLAGCGLVARHDGPLSSPQASRAARMPPEQQWARTAWRYVENNTDYETGLVGGMDRQPVFTAWNAADALAAIVAAHELGVIDAREFDLRLSRVLGFLGRMDLSGGMLPNKAYHAGTGKMVNFGGQPEDIGWSAVDTGRLMLWLKIVGQRYPRFAEYADKAVLRWSFCEVIDDCGALSGTARSQGQLHRYAEGRLGYEQLAARGFAAWGFDARRTLPLPPTQVANVFGMPLAYDARDPRTSGAQAPLLTMPFALMAMEGGGGDAALAALGRQVYQVQEERWRREHQFTARTDWQLREPPYVVLDSVYAAGYPFNTLDNEGREHAKLALVSTRAAFAMWAVWPGDYPGRLVESVRHLYDADRGWFEGRLESGGPQATVTLSTNAAILEALLYKAKGPLLKADSAPGYFSVTTADPFLRSGRCLPRERPACTAPAR